MAFRVHTLAAGIVLFTATAQSASAQQPLSDVLSFLLTNRSIATGDFTQDERAAAATRDTISRFLLLELTTLPISSSAGGFTYRLDPKLGTVVRSTESFGPFFIERSLTAGKFRASLGIGYQSITFENIDGRSLRDGTLVAIASTLRGEPQPFDVETVSMRLHSDMMTFAGNFGVTDRLDLSATVPFIRLTLRGERVDTYRGRQFLQAAASASSSGAGDLVVRAKYNVLRGRRSGLALGAETRLPTGSEEDLLGSGQATLKPRLIGSVEGERVGVHGDVGYSFGGLADVFDYGAAITVVAVDRLTLVGEIVGRRLESFGRLTETTEPHPRLVGVDTIRLTSVREPTQRAVIVAGLRWNIAATWLMSANIVKPITTSGLNADWVPALTFDYSFGR